MSEEIRNLSSSVIELSDAFWLNDNERVDDLLNEIVKSAEELKTINKKMKSEQKEAEQAKKNHKSHRMFKRIRIVSKRRIRKIKRISKEKLNNFKQRLKMLFSTKSFQSILLTAKQAGLVVENSVLRGMNNTAEKITDAKDFVKDKAHLLKQITIVQKDLTKLRIQTKVSGAKKVIKNTSKEGLEILKSSIKDAKLTATTYVGASALYAKDAIKDKTLEVKDTIVDKKEQIKEKIVDKALLAKYRIRTKLTSKKNIICRKTAMQIALFKKDVKQFFQKAKEVIKDKYDKIVNVDDEVLSEKKQKIEELQQEKENLSRQLLSVRERKTVASLNSKRQELEALRREKEKLAEQIFQGNDSMEMEGMSRAR